MHIHKFSFSEGIGFWQQAWRFTRPQWPLLFGVAVVAAAINMVVNAIPMIGSIAGPFVSVPLAYGSFLIGMDLRAKGDFSFKRLFEGFTEEGTFKALLPACAFAAILGAFNSLCVAMMSGLGILAGSNDPANPAGAFMGSMMLLGVTLLFAAVYYLFVFVPMLVVKDKLGLGNALKVSAVAVMKNSFGFLGMAVMPFALAVVLYLIPYLILKSTADGESTSLPLMSAGFMYLGGGVFFGVMIFFFPALQMTTYLLYEKIFLHQPGVELQKP